MDSFVHGRTKTACWECLPGWDSVLFGPDGLKLDQWLANGQVEVVKHGPHRSVYRVTLGDRQVYVKHYRCCTIWDRARLWIRPSQARREWLKAKEIARRGVSTVQPLALQEGSRGGTAGESFLVTQAISDSCALGEYWRRFLSTRAFQEQGATRRRLLAEVARFVAEVHEAGIDHNDLHPGNLLVALDGDSPRLDPKTGHYRFHLIDVPGVRISGPLPWPAVRDNLTMLNAAWRVELSESDRRRFWRAYCTARPGLEVPPAALVRRQFEERTEQLCRRRLRRRDRRALRTSCDFVALRTPSGRSHGVSELPLEALRQLAAAPRAFLRENMHQPVKLDRGSVIVEAELPLSEGAVRVAYKHYRPRKWWKVFLAPFRPARAVQSWQRGHALQLRGISAARPIAAVDCRRPWYRCESYLAVQWVEGSENLHLYLWRMAGEPQRVRDRQANRCAESLGRLLGKMHARRVLHGDLKASNLMVTDRDGQIETCLVDLDDVCLDADVSLSQRATDLARLAVGLGAHPWLARTVCVRFLRAYLKSGGCPAADWKPLWREVASRSDRVTRRKRRKRQAVL